MQIYRCRVISPDGTSGIVFLWDETSHIFIAHSTAVHSQGIDAVLVTDFDRDGRLDVLARNASSIMQLYLRSANSFDVHASVAFDVGTAGQFGFVTDATQSVSLFGPDSTGHAVLWRNGVPAGGTFTQEPFMNDTARPPLLLDPSAHHAYVDVDGDCRADLVAVTCVDAACTVRVLSVWSNSGSAFTHAADIALPAGATQPVFADFNGDGTVDFAVAVPSEERIIIFGNAHAVPSDTLCSESPVPFTFPPMLHSVIPVPVRRSLFAVSVTLLFPHPRTCTGSAAGAAVHWRLRRRWIHRHTGRGRCGPAAVHLCGVR